MNRQMVVAKINNGIAIPTSLRTIVWPGQSAGNCRFCVTDLLQSSRIIASSCSNDVVYVGPVEDSVNGSCLMT